MIGDVIIEAFEKLAPGGGLLGGQEQPHLGGEVAAEAEAVGHDPGKMIVGEAVAEVVARRGRDHGVEPTMGFSQRGGVAEDFGTLGRDGDDEASLERSGPSLLAEKRFGQGERAVHRGLELGHARVAERFAGRGARAMEREQQAGCGQRGQAGAGDGADEKQGRLEGGDGRGGRLGDGVHVRR